MQPFISLKNIVKTYRKKRVLDGVTVDFYEGQVVALLGPNGSGKTTLLKILMDLVHPDAPSQMELLGQPIPFDLPTRVKTGYMPQSPAFPDNLRAHEIIEYLKGFSSEEPIHFDGIMERMGIWPFYEKYFRELSGGMKQKLNALQAFMYDRKILVLDEPSAGLDPYHAAQLKELIREQKRKGALILITTHILSEIEEVADYMVLLIDGIVRAQENPRAFIAAQKAQNLEGALRDFR